MLGKQLAAKEVGHREGFRWRGEEITRIEGMSDAVFAFAVTLLVISIEVPRSYNEFVVTLKGFFPFAVCFVQLMLVWYNQYLYFRRYNLQDTKSIVLTMLLLFVVLFYVYPLKYVFMTFFTQLLGPMSLDNRYVVQELNEVSGMFTIYACGFIAVYVVFFLLYHHAYQSRHTLKLTELEEWDTLHERRETLLMCGIGLLSLILANTLPLHLIGLAGFAYSLLGILIGFHEGWSGKHRKRIYARLYPMEVAAATTISS